MRVRLRLRLLLELAARVLHEQVAVEEGRVVGGVEGGARLVRLRVVHERVAVVQDQALADLAVHLEAVADLRVRARLGKVAHVYDAGGVDGSGQCGR